MIRPKLLTTGGDADIYIGEAEFTGPGTFTFRVPLSVTRIHACCIGGGAQGAAKLNEYQSDWSGGGGGGLAWRNNIEVTPGETLTVQVGSTVGKNGVNLNNGDSLIKRDDDVLIEGNAPVGFGGGFRSGGSFSGDGGGSGGNGSDNSTYNGAVAVKGSGGGAGGYTGAGGSGGYDGGSGSSGTGGGGGGGGGLPWSNSGTKQGRRGGGTGLKGAGASGAGGSAAEGAPGSGGDGPKYGAGGAGERDGWSGADNTLAGHGAVRIIWGNRFNYPYKADVGA